MIQLALNPLDKIKKRFRATIILFNSFYDQNYPMEDF